MDTGEKICYAINNKKKISFEYSKEGKVKGLRFWNPHAFFNHKSTNNPTVDIWQTDGVTDTPETPFPFWRPFLFDFIDNLQILDETFEVTIWEEPYESNPISGKYTKVVCKI